MASWYGIQLTADALTPVNRKIGMVGPKGGRYVVPITRGKLLVEHSLRGLDVELYIPWKTKRIVHSRTKKEIDRDFPMIPGYAFIHGKIDDCVQAVYADGVKGLMTHQSTMYPARIPESEIGLIRWEEWRLYQAFIDQYRPLTQKVLEERFQHGQTLLSKAGSMINIENEVLGTTGRKTVRTMIQMFNQMVPTEVPVTMVEVA